MIQRFFSDQNFYLILFSYDEDLAEKARLARCPECGATLHRGNFQRKPRGLSCDTGKQFSCRFSFCCSNCRKRLTPTSIRFLGRKVYLGAVIVLISAMLGGASPRRRRILHELCGADERTLARWRTWWAEAFTKTSVWKCLAPALALCGISDVPIPRRLLRAMPASPLEDALSGVLRLLLPLTGGRWAG